MSWRARSALVLAACLLVSACGSAAGSPAPAQPQTPAAAPQTPTKPLARLSFRLPWLVSGTDAPFALGIVKGLYKQHGLDVQMGEGKGSVIVGEAVANGADQIGFIDTGSAIGLISKGAPLKVIGVYTQKSPFAFMYVPPANVNSIADLKGKVIFDSPGTPELAFLPSLLKQAGLTMKDVTVEHVDPNTLISILARHPEGIRLGYVTDYLSALRVTPNAKYKLYSDFGFNLYNLGIVAGTAELQAHPDEVRGFMAASSEAWAEAVKNPDEAVADLVQLYPKADPKLMKQQFEEAASLLHTPQTQGHAPGWMAAEDWRQTLDLMHQFGNVETVKPAGDYYTNAFQPQS